MTSGELAYRLSSAARQRATWVQLCKFGLVGGSGYVINLGVFALLAGGLGAHHAIAALGAFCVAVTNNFLWNRYWTFGPGTGSAHFQAARFFAVSLASLGLNIAVLELPGAARARSANWALRRSPWPSRCRSTSSATSSGPSPSPTAERAPRGRSAVLGQPLVGAASFAITCLIWV